MEEMRNVYKILVRKPEEKRSVGRPRRRWEDNIKLQLWERWLGVWIGFIWLRIRTGEHGNEPSDSIKGG
jgi:hypothetical protein